MNVQPTRKVLDKNIIIQMLAEYAAYNNNGSAEEYVNDHNLLDNTVRQIQNFPWQEVADRLKLDRWRLYHWYFETFQRSLNAQMEKDDLQMMKDLIKDAAMKDIILDKQFQQHIKDNLSKEYHRSTFSIAFNNAKRQVYKETNRTEPPRVPFQQIKPVVVQISKQTEKINEELKKNIQTQKKQENVKEQIQAELKKNLDLLMQQREELCQKTKLANEMKLETTEILTTQITEHQSPLLQYEHQVDRDNSFITDCITTEISTNEDVIREMEGFRVIIPDFYNAMTFQDLVKMEEFYKFDE
ncbi:Conserved_hypothetical protein [Hexamita inflata]|uniref:Uncharacterized protein n=1 Tax=Hexamita inflata TaxID=28002 RepID=A0AA86TX93_9EUKA|nr:Conserved hypothetical protein [Hexamita inflata]